MKLNLKRPLAFIDIESTGLNVEEDRIIELSVCKFFPDGSIEKRTRRFNPDINIPFESTEIHGITNEDVKDLPNFAYTANGLLKLLAGCDIAGFNSNRFDVPMLYFEFQRADILWDYKAFKMIDVGNIFKIQEPRTLEAAVKFYCNREHEKAHSAEADTIATVDVFLAQLEKYELPEDIEELAIYSNHGNKMLDLSGKFVYDKDGDIIFNFGPHRKKKVKDELSFVAWMTTKDFNVDTKDICHSILEEFNY